MTEDGAARPGLRGRGRRLACHHTEASGGEGAETEEKRKERKGLESRNVSRNRGAVKGEKRKKEGRRDLEGRERESS